MRLIELFGTGRVYCNSQCFQGLFRGRSLVFISTGSDHRSALQGSPNYGPHDHCPCDPLHCATNDLSYNNAIDYRLCDLQQSEHSENRIEIHWKELRWTPGIVRFERLHYIEQTRYPACSVLTHLFFRCDISVIFCRDILVTETFRSFFSQLYQKSP